MEANKAYNHKSFLGHKIGYLNHAAQLMQHKSYVWALCARGWLCEAAALSIHTDPYRPQRLTAKQMLIRHLTFTSITPPLCPLLPHGITVRSTGETGSEVRERDK